MAFHWPAMGQRRISTVPDAMKALRNWQRYHQDTLGWSDIGYQVAVDQLGNSYQLRGFGIRSGANGNTTVNNKFGAILLILGEGEQPSKAMMTTARRLVSDWRAFRPGANDLVGHEDIRPEPTQCPGPIVRRLILTGAFEPQEDDVLNDEDKKWILQNVGPRANWRYKIPPNRNGNFGGPAEVLMRQSARSLSIALNNQEITREFREILLSKGIAGATADEIIDELSNRLSRDD